jgi:hypothetical protein
MTVTVELAPEIEAKYAAEAAERGVPLKTLLKHVLEERATPKATPLTPAERAHIWRESAKSLPRTRPLSDEAISRESIYGDRG